MNTRLFARILVKKYGIQNSEDDDTSYGPAIPSARVKFLKDQIARLFLDVTRNQFGAIYQLYSNLPALKTVEGLMVKLVNKLDSFTLRQVYDAGHATIIAMNEIRNDLSNNINHFDMAHTIDVRIKTIQEKIWKRIKEIPSSPQLRGTDAYTWFAGPGRSPVLQVRQYPKTPYMQSKQRLTNPNQDLVDAYETIKQKDQPPTFKGYEAMLNNELDNNED